MKKTFFIDFDGTITKVDTCAAMVEAFARDGWEEINSMWEEKKLSTEECANETFKLFNANLDDVIKLMDTIEIDDYFISFLDVCRKKDYKVYVLSDGYDINIRCIFAKYGIDVPYFANELVYEDGFKIKCTHRSSTCGKCGTCKTYLMNRLKEEGSESVYIGDGYSDICPALSADVVFAKGVLYKYCLGKGIDAAYYHNFSDIICAISL